MATLPAFFRKTSETGLPALSPIKPERDPFQLRALPQEVVFLHCKKIDNSRLVREPDPQARGACWSAIGAACFLLAVLTSVLVPSVASTLAGYRLQALRVEERQLLDEKRTLELDEAQLLSPSGWRSSPKGRTWWRHFLGRSCV